MLLIAAAATFGEDMNHLQSVLVLTEIAFSVGQAGFDRVDEGGILGRDHG
jgi:hypothetical protein